MQKLDVNTFEDLITNETEILNRIRRVKNGGVLFLASPFELLEDVNVNLSKQAKTEIKTANPFLGRNQKPTVYKAIKGSKQRQQVRVNLKGLFRREKPAEIKKSVAGTPSKAKVAGTPSKAKAIRKIALKKRIKPKEVPSRDRRLIGDSCFRNVLWTDFVEQRACHRPLADRFIPRDPGAVGSLLSGEWWFGRLAQGLASLVNP